MSRKARLVFGAGKGIPGASVVVVGVDTAGLSGEGRFVSGVGKSVLVVVVRVDAAGLIDACVVASWAETDLAGVSVIIIGFDTAVLIDRCVVASGVDTDLAGESSPLPDSTSIGTGVGAMC